MQEEVLMMREEMDKKRQELHKMIDSIKGLGSMEYVYTFIRLLLEDRTVM